MGPATPAVGPRPLRVAVLVGVLLVFLGVSTVAVVEHGYFGLWAFLFQGTAERQVALDLTIAMFLVMSWIVADARTSGVPAWPYVVVTLLTGSLGPLGYLLHRELIRGGKKRS